MEAPQARTVDELFQQVRDRDIVLTVQPALADALNARIDSARLGKLAYTPRHLAYERNQDQDLRTERGLFRAIISATSMDWKQASYYLDRTIDCWRHTGELDAILDHVAAANDRYQEVIDVVRSTPNIYSAVARTSVSADHDVAVLGAYQFMALDRKVLPASYETVDFVSDAQVQLSGFNVFGSTAALVNEVMDRMREEDPRDVAVVVEPGSRYDALLRSSLESEEIPYLHTLELDGHPAVRGLLSYLKLGLSQGRVKLKEVQPLLRKNGISISVEHDEAYLDQLDDRRAHRIASDLQSLEGMTFRRAVKQYRQRFGELPRSAVQSFEEIGVMDSPVTAGSVARLEYYLDTYDITVEEGKKGVVLVSPSAVSHVDREAVFFLGMDASWTDDVPARPWIDEQREEERHVRDFLSLIQAGSRRYYMVQESHLQDDVTPCLYFSELVDATSFSEMEDRQRVGSATREGTGFGRDPLDVETETVSVLSQSSLNDLVYCPRDYMVSQLVTEPDQPYFRKGSLFHDFAEFYINHPDVVAEQGIDRFVDRMIAEMRPFLDDYQVPLERTVFRLGIQNLIAFLDDIDDPVREVDGYRNVEWADNLFADRFGRPVDRRATELWFYDEELGGKGLVDFIASPTHLVDYKSSSRSSPGKLVRDSNVELFEDRPSLQAILYLAFHRSVVQDEELTFSFFHFLENVDDVLQDDADLDDTFARIRYYPERFEDAVLDRDLFDQVVGDVAESNDRRKTLEKLGFAAFQRFFSDRDLPRMYEKDAVLESDLCDEFIAFAVEQVGDYKYVRRGCRKALKRMVDIRTENYFREDLDRFEVFLQDWIERLNQYRRSEFPIMPADADERPDLDETDNRDLLLTGDGR